MGDVIPLLSQSLDDDGHDQWPVTVAFEIDGGHYGVDVTVDEAARLARDLEKRSNR